MAFNGIKYYQIKKKKTAVVENKSHIVGFWTVEEKKTREGESETFSGFFKKRKRLKGINIFFHGYQTNRQFQRIRRDSSSKCIKNDA